MASKRAISLLTRQFEHAPSRAIVQPTSTHLTCPTRTHICAFQQQMPRLRQPKRHFTTSLTLHKDDPQQQSPEGPSNTSPLSSGIPPSVLYDFKEISSLSSSPDPNKILIDVREPGELLSTGTIPNSVNIPISSAPDAFFLPADEFEDKFGFPRPGDDKEVVFFCKAGVRSKAAARLAGQAGFGGRAAEYPGSWVEWVGNGGKVERVE